MKTIMSLLAIFMTLSIFASEASKTINYKGQNTNTFELISQITETHYKDEQHNSTYTRKIPYQARKYNYKTHYHQEYN